MEHVVNQRSKEWYDLRQKAVVTASRFGDAIGVGKGRPYDFLCSLFSDSQPEIDSSITQHGIDMEPVIHRAYNFLTGSKTRESGFWTLSDGQNPLKGDHADLIGASPDAVVLNHETDSPVGLCEFKAPVYRMYRDIPKAYMAQIQGQMAITGLPWCDFMVVCKAKREIMLRRVYFSTDYWSLVSSRLLQFCYAFKEMEDGHCGRYVEEVKQWDLLHTLGSETINIIDKLKNSMCASDKFCSPSGITLTFDLLTESCDKENSVKHTLEEDTSDEILEDSQIEQEMLKLDY